MRTSPMTYIPKETKEQHLKSLDGVIQDLKRAQRVAEQGLYAHDANDIRDTITKLRAAQDIIVRIL